MQKQKQPSSACLAVKPCLQHGLHISLGFKGKQKVVCMCGTTGCQLQQARIISVVQRAILLLLVRQGIPKACYSFVTPKMVFFLAAPPPTSSLTTLTTHALF
jgi:hypothetical protein